MSPSSFIAALAPEAIRARLDGSPLLPSVRLAQNMLETGFRLHPWNNLGGFKAGGGKPNKWWRGETVGKSTWEVENGKRVEGYADFRVYDTVYDFYRDQDRLLASARYKRVRMAATPEEQAEALQASGYATDPAYASKLIDLIRTYSLTKYDKEAEREEPMTAEERKVLAKLEEAVERLTDTAAAQSRVLESMAERLARLEEQSSMDKPPAWAAAAVKAAQKAGLIDTPEDGSLTFYRLLTVLHRAGMLKK